MGPDVCVIKACAATALLCLWLTPLTAGSPVPPHVLQSDTNLALLPRGALPANFTVLSVALLPDAAAANVTVLPLVPPQLQALPPGSKSVAEELPIVPPQPPDLPPSAVGNAYVLSHVIVEVGILDDDNSTDNSTDNPYSGDIIAQDLGDEKKNEAIKVIESENGDNAKSNKETIFNKDETNKNSDVDRNDSKNSKDATVTNSATEKSTKDVSNAAGAKETVDGKGSTGKESDTEKKEVNDSNVKVKESGGNNDSKAPGSSGEEGNGTAAVSAKGNKDQDEDQKKSTPP